MARGDSLTGATIVVAGTTTSCSAYSISTAYGTVGIALSLDEQTVYVCHGNGCGGGRRSYAG